MNTAHPTLPPAQQKTLRRAIQIEWFTIGFLAVAITGVNLVMGSSQAMKAAWIEDLLSLAPPIAFLIAVRIVTKPPSDTYPYGFFRSVGVAHLVAGVALCTMGAFLLFDSVTGLISGDRPPIGSVQLFGTVIWSGWLMMGVMALTIPLPIYFGRVKMRLAKDLHNKVLYADADMNKADWMTAAGSIVGVGGIGLGYWWADSAAATFIAGSILRDGLRNTRAAITDLMDTRATTFDDHKPHPASDAVLEYLETLPWVREVAVRVRDQGQFFHLKAFIVPVDAIMPTLADLRAAQQRCEELDWKLTDVVLILTTELPKHLSAGNHERQAGYKTTSEGTVRASATQSTVRQIGSALGTAFARAALSISLAFTLPDALRKAGISGEAAESIATATRQSAGTNITQCVTTQHPACSDPRPQPRSMRWPADLPTVPAGRSSSPPSSSCSGLSGRSYFGMPQVPAKSEQLPNRDDRRSSDAPNTPTEAHLRRTFTGVD